MLKIVTICHSVILSKFDLTDTCFFDDADLKLEPFKTTYLPPTATTHYQF